ncbi:MAG: type II toxin-antitoxin system Phd/YefM family antitoxin [Candidatus Electrothrix sp. YB6]
MNFDAARRGEEVVITFHGKPYAKIIPLDKQVPKARPFGPRLRNQTLDSKFSRNNQPQAAIIPGKFRSTRQSPILSIDRLKSPKQNRLL